MLITILSFLHNATTLLFGVYISAAFLGVRMNRRNILTLFLFSCAVGIVYIISFVLFNESVTEQLYPLIVHLPLTLFLTLRYKHKAALSALSVLIAYLCCQISNWMGLAAMNLTQLEWVYYSVRITITVAVFILLIRFVSDAAAQLLQKPTKAILILGIMPFVYYLFDYATGVYTALLYSGLEVVVEFLGFMLCTTYILFLFLYFKQYEENREAEQRNRLLEMQHLQAEKELEAIRRSEHAVSIIRHDMRHFLANIKAFIENGENDKALTYISEITDATDKTAMQRYCKNEIVNMILSSYKNKIKNNSIDFKYSVRLPEKLPISDVDMTAILSNGLENAVRAVLPLEPDKRHIELDLHMNDSKLLLSIKNTFAEKPVFADGLPQSKKADHGFGTQSIRYVAEKLKGNCQFTVSNGMFILRVIL